MKSLFIIPNLSKRFYFHYVKKITRFYKRSPYYRGVVLWDALSAGVQRATSKVKFKQFLNKIEDLRALLNIRDTTSLVFMYPVINSVCIIL